MTLSYGDCSLYEAFPDYVRLCTWFFGYFALLSLSAFVIYVLGTTCFVIQPKPIRMLLIRALRDLGHVFEDDDINYYLKNHILFPIADPDPRPRDVIRDYNPSQNSWDHRYRRSPTAVADACGHVRRARRLQSSSKYPNRKPVTVTGTSSFGSKFFFRRPTFREVNGRLSP